MKILSKIVFSCVVVLAMVTFAIPAWAGPIDSALGALIGSTPSWWIELVALISAVLGLVSALVKDSSIPGWVSTLMNLAASNWGAASNDPQSN